MYALLSVKGNNDFFRLYMNIIIVIGQNVFKQAKRKHETSFKMTIFISVFDQLKN